MLRADSALRHVWHITRVVRDGGLRTGPSATSRVAGYRALGVSRSARAYSCATTPNVQGKATGEELR